MPMIKVGVATLTLRGQAQSGDRHTVMPFPDGCLVAVVDGLGHGEKAAFAASAAIRTLETHAEEPVISLVRRCHENLRSTRGVVMSLASFSRRYATVAWLGVGNVEGIILRDSEEASRRECLLLRGGVVGNQLPRLQAAVVEIIPGDTLIFASDGIRMEFTQDCRLWGPPQRTADMILDRYHKSDDDALVVVAQYEG